MTLGGRKRHLQIAIDVMIADTNRRDTIELGQWLVEMGHMILLSEEPTIQPRVATTIASDDFSFVDRIVPPDQLN